MQDDGDSTASGSIFDQAMASEHAAEHLKTCQSRAATFITLLHGKFIAALDAQVAALSAEDCADEQAAMLLDELRLLQLNKDKFGAILHERCRNAYRDAINADCNGNWPGMAAGAGGLSLVDDQQLEEWLKIDKLVSRIQDAHDGEIRGLFYRFRNLVPELQAESSGHPLGPDRFCWVFRDALDQLAIAPRVRTVCYDLFGAIFGEEAGAFYQQMNRLLIARGVMPDLRVEQLAQAATVSRKSTATHQEPPLDASWSDEVESEPVAANTSGRKPAPTPIQEQMFQAMQQLLNVHFRQTLSDGAGLDGDGKPLVHLPVTPMLVETLSTLQHDEGLLAKSGELIRGGLRRQVVGQFPAGGSSGQGGINQIDNETIEVISMIFDYILDDHSLPDFMKALIGRLQIPVLKVAILDREFFSRRDHPARQLLNELSRAGLGWREEDEAAKDRLYLKMEATVRRILDDFDNDITIFDELLTDFRAFLDEESHAFDQAQHRLLEAAQEQNRLEKVRARVAHEIACRLVDQPLPDEIREFIVTPWREYATTVALECADPGSDAMTPVYAFVDDLVWSLRPKSTAEDRKRLVTMLPAMLRALHDGMRRIDHPDDDTQAVIAALERHHFECMKATKRQSTMAAKVPSATTLATEHPAAKPVPSESGAASRSGDVDRLLNEISEDMDRLSAIDWDHLSSFDDVVRPPSADNQDAFDRMIADMGLEMSRDDGPRIDDEFTALVRDLDLGTWVELNDAQGRRVRAQLAWKGDDYSDYSFVNRQYKVVAECPLYVLAERFRQGEASIIENVALFDRAINGVISGITRLAGLATDRSA